MDMEGTPDGSRAVNADTASARGIHHDALNENNEETWSALGDQDEPSNTGSDPGMLPPPLPMLSTLGSIMVSPQTTVVQEESENFLKSDTFETLGTVGSFSIEGMFQSPDEDSARGLRLELEFTPSSHIHVGLVTSSPKTIFHRIACSKNDVKSSKARLTSKSTPSLYQSCSTTSITTATSGSLFCRICHEGGSTENFISPCCCRGSLSRVHKTCLERWLAESDSSHCELCGFKYRTRRVPKYGVLTSILAWLTSSSTGRERRNLFVDIIALLIISPIIGLSTILALQLADSLFIFEPMERYDLQQVPGQRAEQPELGTKHTLEMVGTMISRLGQMGIISMVITMDMAYISWVAMRLQSHVTKWYTWYRRNCKVTLIGYPDQVLPPLRHLSSISVHQISF